MMRFKAGDLILGLYRVEQLLGRGAMGAVFKIHNVRRQVDLAVKVPTNDALETFGGLEAFHREAETWVNLGFHPHVVRCDYVRKVDEIPLLFVEYVSGGTLLDWIRNRRLYEGSAADSLARMLDVAIQFAWGLIHAHNQRVIHQDVKPANVMLTVDCTAKVGDFGLASSKPQKGTPAYWSPEQAKIARIKDPVARDQLSITATTDVWSWAVSVLEMFSGDATWLSGSLARRILDDYLISGPKIPSIPRMPKRLAGLLAECLEKDPERRPQTMLEVAEELKAIRHIHLTQLSGAYDLKISPAISV